MGKILTLEQAVALRMELAAQHKTLVFTNGHFDLIHVGHWTTWKRRARWGRLCSWA
jgi:bifunctional ADP-heptose synthase (sugar kinase/adenylyltransferase)